MKVRRQSQSQSIGRTFQVHWIDSQGERQCCQFSTSELAIQAAEELHADNANISVYVIRPARPGIPSSLVWDDGESIL